jgi:hypothetical protein
VAIGLSALAVLGTGTGYVYANTGEVVFSGCLARGTLSGVTTGAPPTCAKGATLVSWNNVGPQGPKGDVGAVGPTGAPGPTGPRGPSNGYFAFGGDFDAAPQIEEEPVDLARLMLPPAGTYIVTATTTFTNMAPENRNATCSLVVNNRLLRRTMVFLGANDRDVVTFQQPVTLGSSTTASEVLWRCAEGSIDGVKAGETTLSAVQMASLAVPSPSTEAP